MTDAISWHWQIFAEFIEKHRHAFRITSFRSFEGYMFHLSPSMPVPVLFSTTHRCHCHHLQNVTAGAQPGVFESPAHESAAHLWGSIIELHWSHCGTRTTDWNDVSCFMWRYDLPMTIETRRSWNAWKSASRWAPDDTGQLGANHVNWRQRSWAFRYWVFPVLAFDRYEELPFCNGICFPFISQFSHSMFLVIWTGLDHLQYLAEHSLKPVRAI